MAGTGRKPFETTYVVPFGAGNQRLRPPSSLAGAREAGFPRSRDDDLPQQFRPSDLPLLCRWSELTVMAEQAAGELQAGGMVTADGRVSPWVHDHGEATKSLTGLALRLRLGPQSRARREHQRRRRPPSATTNG